MKVRIALTCLLSCLVVFGLIGCSEEANDPVATTFSIDDAADARRVNDDGAKQSAVNAKVGIPAHMYMETYAEGCTNNKGPYITLNGELTLGGLNGLLIYRNNMKGTHEGSSDVVVSVTILEEGESIRFAKQPPLGGVGGNPWILAEFTDGDHNAITGEVLLGRCVQGLNLTDFDFSMFGHATADISTGDCDNSGGPEITMNGELKLGGINLNLIFRNNAKGTHERYEEAEVSIVILPKDESLTWAKQPPRGGAGGNPHLFFAFADKDGNKISDEFYLGRCVQLSK